MRYVAHIIAAAMCVALLALYAESFRTPYHGLYHDGRGMRGFAWRGRVYIVRERFSSRLLAGIDKSASGFYVFEGETAEAPNQSGQVIVAAPLLPLISVSMIAVFPVRSWYRRARRRHLGQCVYCGYSLRGLPEARCPECGRDVEQRKGCRNGDRAKKPGKEDANEMGR